MRFTTGKMKNGKLVYSPPRKLTAMIILAVVAAVILAGVALSSLEDGYGMCYVIGGKAYCFPVGPSPRK